MCAPLFRDIASTWQTLSPNLVQPFLSFWSAVFVPLSFLRTGLSAGENHENSGARFACREALIGLVPEDFYLVTSQPETVLVNTLTVTTLLNESVVLDVTLT